ncbi:hypothetical protein FJ967_32780, partial [Mesorhizobium sp. B2-3-4]
MAFRATNARSDSEGPGPAGQRGAPRVYITFLGLLVSLLLLPLAAFAADLPALTGRVVDNAGIIDAGTRAALTQKLAAFEAKGS